MAYAVYIKSKSVSGWSKSERHGATKNKKDAIKYAQNKKMHSNRPLRYNIRKIKGTQGYKDIKTGKSVLPKHKQKR